MGWLLVMFILYFLFDVNYFIRSCLTILYTLVKSMFTKTDLFDESIHYGICLTTDLDLMAHMNNSRYLRECDFARQQFFLERRLRRAMKQLNAKVMNAGNNIRYRKSIEFLDVYKIKTKILYWDDRAIYLEQQMVRNKDGFICAINICKMCVIGCTPQTLLTNVYHEKAKVPAPSTEIVKLLESWQLSSERLRKSA